MFKPAVATQMNRSEKIALILNHTPSEDVERVRNVLQTATDEQLDILVRSAQRVAAKNVAELEMKTAQANLLLSQNGLQNCEQNRLILQAHLGDYYSFEKARELILSNATVRAGLIWRSIPFAEYDKAIFEQQADEASEQAKEQERDRKQRAIFNAAVRELLRHGINVASTDANYKLVEEHLHLHAEFNVQNVVDAIKNAGLTFSPNDPQAVTQLDQEDRKAIYASIRPRLGGENPTSKKIRELVETLPVVELRNRISATTVLGDNWSRDSRAKDEHFCSKLASASSTDSLQAEAETVLHNRKLRQEVNEGKYVRAQQQPQSERDDGYRPIPLSIDGDAVVKASPYQIREWLKLYGKEQIDAKIREYKHLVTWQRKQLSNVDLGDE